MSTATRRRCGAAAALLAPLVFGAASAGVAYADETPAPGSTSTSTVSGAERELRTPDRYLKENKAKRVSWGDLLADGKKLPENSKSCGKAWRGSGKDRRIDWSGADYRCMSGLLGATYRPQGVGGSATTEHYQIDGVAAAERNLVITSWYNTAGPQTKLVVMDLDQGVYNVVTLVRPGANGSLHDLSSHGSGLVWAGQYLYSSSHSELWMYNADDILKVKGGDYVLPAVARWRVSGDGGLSSLSLDQTTVPTRLVGIDYSKAGQATLQSFDLTAPDNRLTESADRADGQLVLTNTLGDERRVIRSSGSQTIAGSSFQGVARYGPYTFANSSALHLGGRVFDATVVIKDGQALKHYRMPWGNGQSIYIDYLRGTYVSMTEAGSQFLYALPLKELMGGDDPYASPDGT